jgi:hypothetical protein
MAQESRWPVPFPVLQPELGPLDTTTLPKKLKRAGLVPPFGFKALVIEIDETEKGLEYRAYDYNGTSTTREDWWPASTVKIYAAVAALEKLRSLGFSPKAELVYNYREKPLTTTAEDLVQRAITPSHNLSFDRLVELVGFDALHQQFLNARHGLAGTVLLRAYGGRLLDKQTGRGYNRHSPAITVNEGDKTLKLPELNGTSTQHCPGQGNCTSLVELAETIRRVVLHEKLPPKRRFDLGPKELELLRGALAGKRTRGAGVVNGLKAGFAGQPLEFYHKPGYAARWFSDVVFVKAPESQKQWIVAMAGHGGRDALDQPAQILGSILAKGPLIPRSKEPTSPQLEPRPETPGDTDVESPESPEP